MLTLTKRGGYRGQMCGKLSIMLFLLFMYSKDSLSPKRHGGGGINFQATTVIFPRLLGAPFT